jgi:transcriptional regulator with XRE-family HTH domain
MISIAPEKVRAARRAAGLRIQAAARAATVNYKTIEAYEGHGEATPPARPKLETLLALAKAYKCNPREFAVDPAEWDRVASELGLKANPSALASA